MIYIITGLTIFVSVGVSWLLYRRKFSIWELAVLPALLMLAFTAGVYWFAQMGAPIVGEPQGRFAPIANIADKTTIYLWAWSEDRGHRLYKMPYSRELKKQLDKGGPLEIRKDRNGLVAFGAAPYDGEQITK